MGILDGLIEAVTGVIAQVPVVGAPAAQVISQATDVVGLTSPAGAGPGGGLLGNIIGVATSPLDILQGAIGGVVGQIGGKTVDLTGFGGGNGRFATRTIVETLDTQTGVVVKRRTMPGSPHIMNSEIRAAKKVFRQSRKLESRLPRRTVKQSKSSQLSEAAIDKAIRDTQSGDCPTKC